jgi:hypothetical protein
MSEQKKPEPPAGMRRRAALRVIGAGLPAAAFASRGVEAGQAAGAAAQAAPAAPGSYAFQFLTEAEQATARLLADMIIPADSHSGSASEAGAVEYMDEYAAFWGDPVQIQLRGGLLWLDRECRRRFDRDFGDCDDAQRRAVLDDIAYPERLPPAVARAAEASAAQPEVFGVQAVRPEANPAPLDPELERLRHGVAFFILFRNLVQGGFYSSQIGVDDLGFQGNIPTEWNGCPPQVLKKIGIDA